MLLMTALGYITGCEEAVVKRPISPRPPGKGHPKISPQAGLFLLLGLLKKGI